MEKSMPDLLSSISPFVEPEGFSRVADGFFRIRSQFADYISVQIRSDGSAAAMNVGVMPLFLLPEDRRGREYLEQMSEVDCYIRTRLAPEGSADYWVPLSLARELLTAQLFDIFRDRGLSFFGLFSSVAALCGILTVEGIKSGRLPWQFAMTTKSRLALLAAKANIFCANRSAAKELAEYGLSVSGMAVAAKREFKAVIDTM